MDKAWLMIVQDGGKKKVRLYQDCAVFKSIRNADYKVDGRNWNLKGVWFPDLEAAQNYIQMARHEEGVHWSWPQEIPVWWKTGPFTQKEIEDFLKVAGSIEVTVWPNWPKSGQAMLKRTKEEEASSFVLKAEVAQLEEAPRSLAVQKKIMPSLLSFEHGI